MSVDEGVRDGFTDGYIVGVALVFVGFWVGDVVVVIVGVAVGGKIVIALAGPKHVYFLCEYWTPYAGM